MLQIASRRQMGKSGGLRDAITTTAVHNPVNGSGQVNSMTDRNINRIHPKPGPQRRADSLTVIYYFGVATRLLTRRFMVTTQSGLGTTNGGRIQK